jgi:hypothetical protein
LTVEYWQDVRQKLLHGEVPALQMYPDASRLGSEAETETG